MMMRKNRNLSDLMRAKVFRDEKFKFQVSERERESFKSVKVGEIQVCVGFLYSFILYLAKRNKMK